MVGSFSQFAKSLVVGFLRLDLSLRLATEVYLSRITLVGLIVDLLNILNTSLCKDYFIVTRRVIPPSNLRLQFTITALNYVLELLI